MIAKWKQKDGRALRVLMGMTVLAFALAPTGRSIAQGGFAAQAMPTGPVDPHDLSGYWEIGYDDRSVAPADLTAEAKQMMQKMRDADLISQRYCRPLGMPATMDPGRPISITQGKYELLITAPVNSQHRHIYFRDKHTNPDILDPSSDGESIAHWEGDTLVVDTVGFHEKNGRMLIPGGGYRTPNSHLVERFKLLKNGQVLSVTSTWTDPKVFAKPHTYEYWYHRINGDYEPLPGIGCNAWDPERSAFIDRSMSPAQKKASDAAMVPPGSAPAGKY
jgi:hypothetical protein